MKSMHAYLIFDGKCRQAMEYYKTCFGGDLHMVPYSARPGGSEFPECKDWIMHASLTIGPLVFMASDSRPDMPVHQGNNFSITIHCESLEEIEKFFKILSTNGKVKMPLTETFFSQRFGMLVDQFGVHWMLNLG